MSRGAIPKDRRGPLIEAYQLPDHQVGGVFVAFLSGAPKRVAHAVDDRHRADRPRAPSSHPHPLITNKRVPLATQGRPPARPLAPRRHRSPMSTKTCPFCANEINAAAIKCQYCHEMLGAAEPEPPPKTAPTPPPEPVSAPAETIAGPRPRPKPAVPRRQLNPVLALLMGTALVYFVGAAIYHGVHGEIVGAIACLVAIAPFLVLAPVGWWLGDVFRRFAMPSWYMGSGAIDMAKQRLFWMVGPQAIGVFVPFFLLACVANLPAITSMKLGFPKHVDEAAPAASAAPVAASDAEASGSQAEPPSAAPVTQTAAAAQAQFTDDLVFDDYPATPYAGPAAYPNFQAGPATSPAYQGAAVAAIRKGANFAGNLALFSYGCGPNCTNNGIVDVRTGQLHDIPVSDADNPDFVLSFSADSDLLLAWWNGKDAAHPSCVHDYFLWTGQGFKPMQKREAPGTCPPPS